MAVICARRSPRARSARRTFIAMMSIRSWLTSPWRWYFMMGICIPSLKMSVVTLPSVPPTSSQWAMQQVKPSSRPSWNTGMVNVKWFRWLPVV